MIRFHAVRSAGDPVSISETGRIQLNGTMRRAIETARFRLLALAVVFSVACLVVALRLVDVTAFAAREHIADRRSASAAASSAMRADIVDRNGALLATSLKTQDLIADPTLVQNADKTAEALAGVLPELNPVETLIQLSRDDTRYVSLLRSLTPQQVYAVNHLGLPGVDFATSVRRAYPNGPLAPHVVGHTDVDGIGRSGIEKRYDARLKGATESPLMLSLDIRVQHIVREELQYAVDRFSAIGGAGIVMDVKTGELLSMVSLPDYDPNRMPDPTDRALFPIPTLGVYEMGSTFKILNTALALESGRVHLGDRFDATKPLRVGRFSIGDFHPENRWLTVPEIFMVSSNIGSAQMALTVGTPTQQVFMKALGLTRRSAIDLPEVGTPIVPTPWREINTMTISYGHGIAVTPIQLMSAVGAAINGGMLHDPTLLRHSAPEKQSGTRVLSPQTSDIMRRLMRLVVQDGTGGNADVPGYVVGGKTGSAEKVGGGGYREKSLLSSFIAGFPMNDPRYLVFIMVDEPNGIKETYGYATGGWTAAPAVGQIIRRIGPMLGVQPVDDTDPEIRNALTLDVEPGGHVLASF